MCGALLPLTSVPSWRAEGQLYYSHMTSALLYSMYAFPQAVLVLQTYGFVTVVIVNILIAQMISYRFNVVVINYIITFD